MRHINGCDWGHSVVTGSPKTFGCGHSRQVSTGCSRQGGVLGGGGGGGDILYTSLQ